MKLKLLIALIAGILYGTAARGQAVNYEGTYNNVVRDPNRFNDTYYGITSPDSLMWRLRAEAEMYNSVYAGNLLVYPNPASSTARIVLPDVSIGTAYVDVIDLNGHIARSFQYAPGTYQLDVDVSRLPISIYSIRLYGMGIGFYNIKLSKQ
jgi:Secretion system C-terminal sorting domain